jgi:hypothetical protein
MTDNAGVVYAYLFVLLGGSTLFGGLCIPYSNLKPIFKPLFYISIPAWGYRSVIINDLVCCHLELTCTGVYTTMMSSKFAEVRDAGQEAYEDCLVSNGTVSLGQLGVLYSDLADSPQDYTPKKMSGVFVLIACAVLMRWLSMVALRVRTQRANHLEIVDEIDTQRKWDDFDGALQPTDRNLS